MLTVGQRGGNGRNLHGIVWHPERIFRSKGIPNNFGLWI